MASIDLDPGGMGPRSWRVQTRWIRACESVHGGHKPRDQDPQTSICGAWDPLHRREGASPMHEGSTSMREGTTCTREGARVIGEGTLRGSRGRFLGPRPYARGSPGTSYMWGERAARRGARNARRSCAASHAGAAKRCPHASAGRISPRWPALRLARPAVAGRRFATVTVPLVAARLRPDRQVDVVVRRMACAPLRVPGALVVLSRSTICSRFFSSREKRWFDPGSRSRQAFEYTPATRSHGSASVSNRRRLTTRQATTGARRTCDIRSRSLAPGLAA